MTTLSIAPREEQIQLQGVPGGLDQSQLVAVPGENDRKVELVYAPKAGGTASSLSLFNGRFVEYRRRGRKGHSAVFNLAFVDPRPSHDVHHALLEWLVASLGLFAIATGAYLQIWLLAATGAGWTAVLGVVARRKQRNRWVFFSRHGRIALFELPQSRADGERLQKLISILAKRGQLAWTALPAGKERLAAEVAEHRRLMAGGTISKDRYEIAKRRIFGRYKA
ncbi:hypothetical protein [Alcanivorax sp. DP30]|uniref:hypothetical protein n=1 Tax=Alcanivorax sp. DP30 TaxID=2606217 RepID=UPI00136BA4AA|nr:hypothetical protein [Alcanivorax sp. DP30]MZR61725.1 hypothetical protein [Alcanivorax sp. DP30]